MVDVKRSLVHRPFSSRLKGWEERRLRKTGVKNDLLGRTVVILLQGDDGDDVGAKEAESS